MPTIQQSKERLTSGVPSPSAGTVHQVSPLSAEEFCIHFPVEFWLTAAKRSRVPTFLSSLLEKQLQ